MVLTASAANEARSVLGNALDDAVMLGLIPANPCRPVRSIRHEEREMVVWSAAEIERFTQTTLAAAAAYHALYYLALTAGLRAGELIALQWSDLKGERLHVSRTANSNGTVEPPKTKAANRILALPYDTLSTLDLHRGGPADARISSRLMFPTATGGMLNHSNLLRSLEGWAKTAEVIRLTVHGLRHTYASMAINAGMAAPELSVRLGHSNPSVTLKRYAHFFELATPRAAPTLAELTSGQRLWG